MPANYWKLPVNREHLPNNGQRVLGAGPAACVIAYLALGGLACHEDLKRFDTGEQDAYCGSIVASDFTRKGYDSNLSMRLTLDISQLDSAPGTLTLDDSETGPCSPRATFAQAAIHTTPSLFADPLSELQFGRSREHNFMGWLDTECGNSALAVFSLMRDGSVEVRLLSRGSDPSVGGDFGVFQLTRNACEG